MAIKDQNNRCGVVQKKDLIREKDAYFERKGKRIKVEWTQD